MSAPLLPGLPIYDAARPSLRYSAETLPWSPEAQAAQAALQAGKPLGKVEAAYYQARQPSTKEQLRQISFEWATVLALTPGPWIHSWYPVGTTGSLLPPRQVESMMSDQAFGDVHAFLQSVVHNEEERRYLNGPLSGVIHYEMTPMRWSQWGVGEEHPLARHLNSPAFKEQLSQDLPTALASIQAEFQGLDRDQRRQALEALCDLIAQVSPLRPDRMSASVVKPTAQIGRLHPFIALGIQDRAQLHQGDLELAELQRAQEKILQNQEAIRTRMAQRQATLGTALQGTSSLPVTPKAGPAPSRQRRR